jgi:hypothetical protein
MNIISFEGRLLHKNYIKVRINNQEYLIQQPVLAYCGNGLKHINKLHLYLKDQPIENGQSLTLPGIGDIKGRYTRREDSIYLLVN